MTPNQPYRPAGLISDALDDYVRRVLISGWECKAIGRYDRYLLRRGEDVTTFSDDHEHAETDPVLVEEFLRDGILPCFPPPRKTRTDKYAGCQNASVRAFVAAWETYSGYREEDRSAYLYVRYGKGESVRARARRSLRKHTSLLECRRVMRSMLRKYGPGDSPAWSAPYRVTEAYWAELHQTAAAQATPDTTTAPVSTP